MADKNTATLTDASTLDGTELLHVLQHGRDRRATALQIASIGHRSALVKRASDLINVDIRTATVMTWASAVYDTGEWFSTAQPTRLTVPPGVSYLRLSANLSISSHSVDTWLNAYIFKNGAAFAGMPRMMSDFGSSNPGVNLHSAIIPVTLGDYFELFGQVENDTTVDITAASSWFCAEAMA